MHYSTVHYSTVQYLAQVHGHVDEGLGQGHCLSGPTDLYYTLTILGIGGQDTNAHNDGDDGDIKPS